MKDYGLISVIVPVYNVEKYLSRCLESLVGQTYLSIEIIVVNDGSEDNSQAIIDNFVSNDHRIISVKKHNGGVSSALNIGIDIANGDYISFVDSDDYVDSHFYEHLVTNLVENGVDVSVCNFNSVEQEKRDAFHYWSTIENNLLWTISRVNKLYKKEVFANYRFPEGHVGEDLFHAVELFKNNLTFFISCKQLYFYENNPNSITHNHHPEDWVDIIDGWTMLSKLFRTMYGKNNISAWAVNNVIEYYFQFRKAYKGLLYDKMQRICYKKIVKSLYFDLSNTRQNLRWFRFRIVNHIY